MAKEKWITTGMAAVIAIGLLTGCGSKDANVGAATDTAKEAASSIQGAQPETQPAESAETVLSESPASDFEYKEEDGKITIAHYTGKSMEIAIPAQIDGKDVTAIGDYCFANSDIVTVVCPNTLETIGESAFANCYELRKIELNYGLQSIGNSAFLFCKSLNFIHIPDSVTLFGEMSFSAAGLTSMEYEASAEELPRSCFSGTDMKEVTISGKVRKMGVSVLANSKELETVVIEDGVESIGKIAIAGCPKLTSITIPASVTEIAEKAFSENSSELVLTVQPGSYAESYAKENGIAYVNP